MGFFNKVLVKLGIVEEEKKTLPQTSNTTMLTPKQETMTSLDRTRDLVKQALEVKQRQLNNASLDAINKQAAVGKTTGVLFFNNDDDKNLVQAFLEKEGFSIVDNQACKLLISWESNNENKRQTGTTTGNN